MSNFVPVIVDTLGLIPAIYSDFSFLCLLLSPLCFPVGRWNFTLHVCLKVLHFSFDSPDGYSHLLRLKCILIYSLAILKLSCIYASPCEKRDIVDLQLISTNGAR